MSTDWMAGAACIGTDPEAFFPDKGDHQAATRARALCSRCPVVDPCLAYALTHPVTGVWGGTTDRMRRRLRQVAS